MPGLFPPSTRLRFTRMWPQVSNRIVHVQPLTETPFSYFLQRQLVDFSAKNGILVMAHQPLGGRSRLFALTQTNPFQLMIRGYVNWLVVRG